MHSSMSDVQLEELLERVSPTGWLTAVVHCQHNLANRLVRAALNINLYGTGIGWFFSHSSMTFDSSELQNYPNGLFGLQWFYKNGAEGFLNDVLNSISCALQFYIPNGYEKVSKRSLSSALHRSPNSFIESSLSRLGGDINITFTSPFLSLVSLLLSKSYYNLNVHSSSKYSCLCSIDVERQEQQRPSVNHDKLKMCYISPDTIR